MKTALISDLHLGLGSDADLLRRDRFRRMLFDAIGDCDRLVLLGDTVELRDRPMPEALDLARPFFEAIGASLGDIEVVLVPGNHDHRLLGSWSDERRLDGGEELGLVQRIPCVEGATQRIGEWLGPASLEVSYPGFWVRDDVFATHGHYLDSHFSLPTMERLAVATVDRAGGKETGIRQAVEDYERVHAPVYELLFNMAQGARKKPEGDKPPTMKVWEAIGGASGRARNLRGRLIQSTAIPAALRMIDWAGLGQFGADFSVAEIGRAGVRAMAETANRLELEQAGASHLIFGHIHRRGPVPAIDGDLGPDSHPELWTSGGLQLHNTGNWVYVPAMLGRSSASSSFWPGSLVTVDEEGPPIHHNLLSEAPHSELARV